MQAKSPLERILDGVALGIGIGAAWFAVETMTPQVYAQDGKDDTVMVAQADNGQAPTIDKTVGGGDGKPKLPKTPEELREYAASGGYVAIDFVDKEVNLTLDSKTEANMKTEISDFLKGYAKGINKDPIGLNYLSARLANSGFHGNGSIPGTTLNELFTSYNNVYSPIATAIDSRTDLNEGYRTALKEYFAFSIIEKGIKLNTVYQVAVVLGIPKGSKTVDTEKGKGAWDGGVEEFDAFFRKHYPGVHELPEREQANARFYFNHINPNMRGVRERVGVGYDFPLCILLGGEMILPPEKHIIDVATGKSINYFGERN